MKSLIDYCIQFYSEREASISVTPQPSDFPVEFNEMFLFCTYVFRQSFNIDQKHPICISLGKSLSTVIDSRDPLLLTLVDPKLKLNSDNPLIELSTTEVYILNSSQKKVDKELSGQVQLERGLVRFIMNKKGFNFLGLGLNYYVPLSVGLLLNHLARTSTNEIFIKSLGVAARQCGEIVLNQEITAPNQMVLAQNITKSLFS
jgi:hypothetical protein